MAVTIVLGIVVVAIVLFSLEAVPLEVSALTIVALLALTGVLTPAEAFAGFANDIVIFLFTLLAMTQGLVSTGVVQLLGQRLSFFTRFGHQAFVLAMMILVAAVSSVLSNTATTAAFLPIAIGAANQAKVPKSRVLLPLAYASMLGGTVFLIGTSTNLVVSAEMRQLGLAPIGIAELAPMALPLAVVGILLIRVLGPRLLPDRQDAGAGGLGTREYVTEAVLTEDSQYLDKPLSSVTAALGATVLGILRDSEALAPRPEHRLRLEDRLIIEGTREVLLHIKDFHGVELRPDSRFPEPPPPRGKGPGHVLVEATLPPGSFLVDRSLRESLFWRRYGLVVLALHRRPALQRLTHLQLLGRVFGGRSLSTLPLALGDVLLLRGPRERIAELADGAQVLVLSDVTYQAPRYPKAALAVSIYVVALSLGIFEFLPFALAGLSGLLAMILTGCLDVQTAFRIDWRVLLLVASVLALGIAMEQSGAGTLLGGWIAAASGLVGPRGVLLLLMTVTILLSTPMSNQAAALVILPVALGSAATLGLDPRPFALGICLAASCSFITPLEPSCVLVFGPGHYKFTDFFRLGTPLTLVVLAMLTVGVPWVWPFEPVTAAGASLPP